MAEKTTGSSQETFRIPEDSGNDDHHLHEDALIHRFCLHLMQDALVYTKFWPLIKNGKKYHAFPAGVGIGSLNKIINRHCPFNKLQRSEEKFLFVSK